MARRATIACQLPGVAICTIRFRHLCEITFEVMSGRPWLPVFAHKLGSQDTAVGVVVSSQIVALRTRFIGLESQVRRMVEASERVLCKRRFVAQPIQARAARIVVVDRMAFRAAAGGKI